MVDEQAWATNTMYLKSIDKFNEHYISGFITAGQIKFLLLHEARHEEGIKNFFTEVYEIYLKVCVLGQPFYRHGA